jgi:hypothetical protein
MTTKKLTKAERLRAAQLARQRRRGMRSSQTQVDTNYVGASLCRAMLNLASQAKAKRDTGT